MMSVNNRTASHNTNITPHNSLSFSQPTQNPTQNTTQTTTSNPVRAANAVTPDHIYVDVPPSSVPPALQAVTTPDTPDLAVEQGIEAYTIWLQVFGVLFVATVLTAAELVTLYTSIFPALRSSVLKILSSVIPTYNNQSTTDTSQSDTHRTQSFTHALLNTMRSREQQLIARYNWYVSYTGIVILCLLSAATYTARYRVIGLAARMGVDPYQDLRTSLFYSLVTIGCIVFFQGLACPIFGNESYACYGNSFAAMTSRWAYTDDYAQMALDTGMCRDPSA